MRLKAKFKVALRFIGVTGADLSLCVFAWEVLPPDANSAATYHLGVFDVNRWYHAQMPGTMRFHGGTSREVCPFFAFLSLKEVGERFGPEGLVVGYF